MARAGDEVPEDAGKPAAVGTVPHRAEIYPAIACDYSGCFTDPTSQYVGKLCACT
jgi:hypothetical protein